VTNVLCMLTCTLARHSQLLSNACKSMLVVVSLTTFLQTPSTKVSCVDKTRCQLHKLHSSQFTPISAAKTPVVYIFLYSEMDVISFIHFMVNME